MKLHWDTVVASDQELLNNEQFIARNSATSSLPSHRSIIPDSQGVAVPSETDDAGQTSRVKRTKQLSTKGYLNPRFKLEVFRL